ncbi:MAG: hypothetical protein K2X48_02425 [Chitinophagaceae bacterium]|nr:hypothetical protein [Chitinophagaceae bacterium]
MKYLIILACIAGVLSFNSETDFIVSSNTYDSIPTTKRNKKKAETPIFSGLLKNYSTVILCECETKKDETIALMRKGLEAKGIRVISQEEYQQQHKEVSERIFKQAFSGGSMSSSEELQEKLKNYPYNIQVLILFTEFNKSNNDILTSLQWQIRYEPPKNNPIKRNLPDSLSSLNTYNQAIQIFCDSLTFYAR